MCFDGWVELARSGDLRIAFVGELSSGKSTLAKALIPDLLETAEGNRNDIEKADVVFAVHNFSQKPSVNGVAFGKILASCRCPIIAVTTHGDLMDGCLIQVASRCLRGSIRRCVKKDVPTYVVSARLWLLSKMEEKVHRTVAAKCFREASGLVPVLRQIERIRWWK